VPQIAALPRGLPNARPWDGRAGVSGARGGSPWMPGPYIERIDRAIAARPANPVLANGVQTVRAPPALTLIPNPASRPGPRPRDPGVTAAARMPAARSHAT